MNTVYVEVIRGNLPDSCPKCGWGLMCNWNEPSVRGNCIHPDCDYGYVLIDSPTTLEGKIDNILFDHRHTSKNSLKEQIRELVKEERRDELIKAAPHQVANFFEVKASDLNASWYLEYVRLRDQLLEMGDF